MYSMDNENVCLIYGVCLDMTTFCWALPNIKCSGDKFIILTQKNTTKLRGPSY